MTERTRDRDERGRVTDEPVFPDAEFLAAVGELELPTTTDVAEHLGCSRSLASDRLGELEEQGEVRYRERGNAKLWVRVD